MQLTDDVPKPNPNINPKGNIDTPVILFYYNNIFYSQRPTKYLHHIKWSDISYAHITHVYAHTHTHTEQISILSNYRALSSFFFFLSFCLPSPTHTGIHTARKTWGLIKPICIIIKLSEMTIHTTFQHLNNAILRQTNEALG